MGYGKRDTGYAPQAALDHLSRRGHQRLRAGRSERARPAALRGRGAYRRAARRRSLARLFAVERPGRAAPLLHRRSAREARRGFAPHPRRAEGRRSGRGIAAAQPFPARAGCRAPPAAGRRHRHHAGYGDDRRAEAPPRRFPPVLLHPLSRAHRVPRRTRPARGDGQGRVPPRWRRPGQGARHRCAAARAGCPARIFIIAGRPG